MLKALLIFGAIGIGASGCAASGAASYADLQGAQTQELPQLDESAYDQLDPDLARFVGEHGGTTLWLAPGREGGAVCLVMADAAGATATACDTGSIDTTGSDFGDFVVIPDGGDVPTDAVAVSKNVFAIG